MSRAGQLENDMKTGDWLLYGVLGILLVYPRSETWCFLFVLVGFALFRLIAWVRGVDEPEDLSRAGQVPPDRFPDC
jgi:hypothetical protein